ncbi:MAG: NADPH-dependent FMN reductase [Halodesulfurarchaeum sp.]
MPPTIAGVVGSLREQSVTRIAVREAIAAADRTGADTRVLDLRDFDLPVFDADERDAGDAPAFREAIRAADAFVLGTPVYHGSFSAPLKNALDYCRFAEFENKTVGMVAVAGGSFPLTALDHLRSAMRALDTWVLPFQVAVPNASDVTADGQLADEELEERLETLGRRTVQYANIEPDPMTFEGQQNVGAR